MKFSCVVISECYYTIFSLFHGTLPLLLCSTVENVSSHTTWYLKKNDQFWCSIIEPLTLSVMTSVQYRLWYLPLVPIYIALYDLLSGIILVQRRGNPRCNSLLRKFGTTRLQNYSPLSFSTCTSAGYCISGTLPWNRYSTSWYYQPITTVWWSGGHRYE